MRRLALIPLLALAGCLRYWLPACLPADYRPCTIQGDCWVDGGWMRPDGSYILLDDGGLAP